MMRHRSASAIVPIPIEARFARCKYSGSEIAGHGTRQGEMADAASRSSPRQNSGTKASSGPETRLSVSET